MFLLALAMPTKAERGEQHPPIYYEDAQGTELVSGAYLLERQDIIDFATRWDPLPVHLSDEKAVAAGFPGMTASGTHLLAIKHRLLHQFGFEHTVIASFGFDEVRFRKPGLPGDNLRAHLTWIEQRESRSRPECGIVKHYVELRRADGEVLLSLYDTLLMRRRLLSGQN